MIVGTSLRTGRMATRITSRLYMSSMRPVSSSLSPSSIFPMSQASHQPQWTLSLQQRMHSLNVPGRRFFSEQPQKNDQDEPTEEEGTQEKSPNQPEEKGEAGVDELKMELEECQQKMEEYKDHFLRAKAEVENIRRIANRDIEDSKKFGVARFAKSLLDVNDNLSRALEAVPPEAVKESTALQSLIEGIEMTKGMLEKSFKSAGIKEENPVGEKFDPNLHNALFQMESTDLEPGVVGQVVQTGYTIHGRVLREAKVGVVRED